MFPAWRIQLGAARRAVHDGRWEEAAEMLAGDNLREFLPAKRLSLKLAGQLIARAGERLGGGRESSAGWRDLRQAARLAPVDADIEKLRQREAARRMNRVYELLTAGAPADGLAELDRMERRNIGGDARRQMQLIARRLTEADAATREGSFVAAADSVAKAVEMLPSTAPSALRKRLQQVSANFRAQGKQCDALTADMHEAVSREDWSRVLKLATELLEMSPRHAAAARARRKAWQGVGMEVTQAYVPGHGAPDRVLRVPRPAVELTSSTRSGAKGAHVDTAIAPRQRGPRFVAWIDGVGGFLVCLGNEIVLGQPSGTGDVDVPILADLSRRHATIRREGEAYVLTPIHAASVNGQALSGPTVLRSGDHIRLGAGAEFRFRRPHALSATAVLDRLSGHKTEPAVDGIVLMGESCVLGPQSHCHVHCRPWESDLVLFRRGEELAFRAAGPFEMDGRTFAAEAPVTWGARIEGEDFGLSFEVLE
ncbi:MAG: FHA domain-containing protein [Planctomycetales bacterium]|nr:FHA domain-containing protein [Planctomycetales bacterium]